MSQEARLKSWCNILGVDADAHARFLGASAEAVNAVGESRVIEQDVMRTRADIAYFRSRRVRRLMKVALLRYCGFYNVGYMQGLNEILAPLFAMVELLSSKSGTDKDLGQKGSIDPLVASRQVDGEFEDEAEAARCQLEQEDEMSKMEHAAWTEESINDIGPLHVSLLLFERIIERLAPVVFASEGVQALQAQLASFHLLLYYFDADLHGFLSQEGMTTNVYAQSWFITLFARRSSLHVALRVWDHLLAHSIDKPHIIIFLGVALLLHNKQKLAALPIELIPETLVRIQFVSEEEVDFVFSRALQLESLIPTSAMKEMRTVGFDSRISEAQRAPGLFELMYRPCLTVSAADIAQSICDSSRTIQYLIIECHPDQPASPSPSPSPLHALSVKKTGNATGLAGPGGHPILCSIQGSLPISTSVILEIWVAQQSSRTREPNLAMLSPAAAAILALLRSCRAPHVHIAICGSCSPQAPQHTPVQAQAQSQGQGQGQGQSQEANSKVHATSIPPGTGTGTGTGIDGDNKLLDDSAKKANCAAAGTGASTGTGTGAGTGTGTLSVNKLKREEAKRENMLPQNQLANALLVLGFSHVCVLKGAGMSPDELQGAFFSLPSHPLHSLSSALTSRTDGFAALVYSLLLAGCTLAPSEGDQAQAGSFVVEAPHDTALAEKIGRHFALQRATTDRDGGGAGAGAGAGAGDAAAAAGGGGGSRGVGGNSTSQTSANGNPAENKQPSSSKGFFGLDFDTVLPKITTSGLSIFSRISSAFAAAKPPSQGELNRAVGADTEL